MDIKEKAEILSRITGMIGPRMDILSAEVVLTVVQLIEQKGTNITIEDINELMKPFQQQILNEVKNEPIQ